MLIESYGPESSIAQHTLRRLRIESSGPETGLFRALYLGDNVLVQDVLVHGEFRTCARLGTRGNQNAITQKSTVHLINVTCRLINAPPNHVTESIFDVAATEASQFLNVAAEVDTPVAFFRAQRRNGGSDTGTTALDVPTSFTAQAISARGFGAQFDGFNAGNGTYSVSIDTLLATDSFFVSAQNSLLETSPPSPALDMGLDPATQLGPPYEAGVSLNGVDRKGGSVVIDRGAYEQ